MAEIVGARSLNAGFTPSLKVTSKTKQFKVPKRKHNSGEAQALVATPLSVLTDPPLSPSGPSAEKPPTNGQLATAGKDFPSIDGNTRVITEGALRSFLEEHDSIVRKILVTSCEQSMRKITAHTERLIADHGEYAASIPTTNGIERPTSPASASSSKPPQVTRSTSGIFANRPAVEKSSGFHKRGSDDCTASQNSRWTRRSSSSSHLSGSSSPQDVVAPFQAPVFADADAMKKQIISDGLKPAYNVCNRYWDTGYCQQVARNHYFELSAIFVIAFNAIWMGYDLDANEALMPHEADPIFIFADNFFCMFFTAEWLIRFGAFKVKIDGLHDSWFVFDGILCCMMVLETWVMTLVLVASSAGAMGNASLAKMLRLVKLVRLARLARVLHSVPELLIVVKGIGVASRAVACTGFLLLFICYIFAIVMRQATDGTELGGRIYPNVIVSMRYLLTLGCAPDLLVPVEDTFSASPVFALVFVCFIIVIVITVMNMLVGILVGVMQAVASVEKEEMLVGFVRTNLMRILEGQVRDADGELRRFDEEGDEHIVKEEFDRLLKVPSAMNCFRQMDVDVRGLCELSEFIFAGDQCVPFQDIMELVLQLRGGNMATVKDIVDLRHFMVTTMRELYEALHGAQSQRDTVGMDTEPTVTTFDGNKAAVGKIGLWGMGAPSSIKSLPSAATLAGGLHRQLSP